jgi:phytol kinase
MVLGWGDGLAAVVGKRLGKSPFRIFNQTKTIPGTVALILASSAATLFMSMVFTPGLDAWTLLLRSGSVGLFAALVELTTPRGFDNITLPILTVLFFHYVALTPMAGPFAAAAAINGIVALGARSASVRLMPAGRQ